MNTGNYTPAASTVIQPRLRSAVHLWGSQPPRQRIRVVASMGSVDDLPVNRKMLLQRRAVIESFWGRGQPHCSTAASVAPVWN